MERGFKSWCENVSVQIRRELGLRPRDALGYQVMADYLEAMLCTPSHITNLSPDTLDVLLDTEKENWSAVTVSHNDVDVVIYNPTHSAARRASDVMHELSHLLIGHRPSTIILSPGGEVALRSYDQAQEDEAAWLSGALLLPRPALLQIARSSMNQDCACSQYGVSADLLTYRMNVTGVTAQVKRLRH